MKKKIFAAALLALAILAPSTSTKAEIICEEGIMVWSWDHVDWICSANSGGGATCILCFDETSVEPDVKG